MSEYTLLLGDCLEVMRMLPKHSMNMVLVDPPYGATQNKWDSIIDLKKMWKLLDYACIPNAAMVFFAAQPFTSVLVSSNLPSFKYDWVWRKPKGTGHLNARKMPMRDKEDILVFYKKQCTYNPQMAEGKPYRDKAGKNHSGTESMTDNYGAYTNFRNDNHGLRYPKSVLEFGVVERDTVHPTQKPVDLLRYLIRTYTNEGDTVLDFTMGSGSTGVACMEENRHFIGIEKEEKYYEIAKQRLSNFDVQEKNA